MWGDEYLFQQLGYKHIEARLKAVTDEDIEREAVHISKLTLDMPTAEDIEEYTQFRKANYNLQMIKSDGFYKALIIIANIILTYWYIKIAVAAIQRGIFIIAFEFTIMSLIFIAGLVAIGFALKKRTHIEKPIGITYGYIVSSSMCHTVQRLGYEHYSYTEEYHSFTDIWIDKEDKFLRKVPQTLYAFKYAGKEYRWSELTYTPVKVLVFPDYRLEVLPAFADRQRL